MMQLKNILPSFLRNRPPARKSAPYIWADNTFPFMGGGVTLGNADLTRTNQGAAAAYDVVIPVRRANDLIANAITGMTMNVIFNNTDDAANDKIVASSKDVRPRHPLTEAIARAEVYHGQAFNSLVVYALNLFGEVYLEKIRNQWQFATDLRWLNPLGMTIIEQRGIIERFQYSWWGNTHTFEPEDIAYKHSFNPLRDNYGSGLTEVGMDEINIKRNLQRYLRAFFINNARPGTVVTPRGEEPWGKREMDLIRDQLQAFHKGTANQHTTLALPKSAEVVALENADIQKQYSVDDAITRAVFLLYGVPLAMAGDSSASTYKDGQEVLDAFYTNTILPLARQLARFYNQQVMPFFDVSGNTRVEFDEDPYQRTGQDDLNKGQLASNIYTSNIATLNEARAAVKLPPLKGGERFANGLTIAELVALPVDDIQPATPETTTPPVASVTEDVTKDAPSMAVMLAFPNNADLTALQKQVREYCKDIPCEWTAPDDFHLTLLYMPQMKDDQQTAFIEALPDISVPELSLGIGSLRVFEGVGKYALHFRIQRNEALLSLQAALYDLADELGIAVSSYSQPGLNYIPHITVGYAASKPTGATFRSRIKVRPDGLRAASDETVLYDSHTTDEPDPTPEGAKSHTHDCLDHALETVKSWDYSKDKARKELNAWRAYLKSGKKRAFTPIYLRGDMADLIQSGIDSGADMPQVWRMAEDRLATQGIEWMQSAFERALSAIAADDESAFIKSIDGIRSEFEDRLTPVIESMRDGSLDNRRRAGNIIRQLIRQFGSRAYRQGLEDAGVDDTPDEDEQAEIDKLLADSSQYVSNFTDELINGAGLTAAQANGRAGIWFNGSVSPLYNAGLLAGNKNQMMEFELGTTEQHCKDCLRLNGQRHRFKDIVKRNLDVPKVGQATECGGWKCDCKWRPMAGKARGSW